MFKFLEHKKTDTWVDNVLVIVIRLIITGFIRLLKFTQPSTPAEQREKMTASPDEQ